MTRIWTLLLALSLIATGCGGGDDGGDGTDVGAADPTAEPVVTTEPAATLEPAVTTEPATTLESTPPAEPAEAVTSTTLVLTGDGLPAGDYTVTVDTAAGQLVSIQQYDGTTFSVDLNWTAAGDVSTVNVHAGLNAAGPPLFTGALADGAGTLTPNLPVDLSGASGRYILATPTNGGDSDERSGIWYVLIPRAPGLVLPVLPDEWRYEGWVTIDGVDVTTGRFSDPATADDFDGFSGEQGGPPLPGEDFLRDAPEGTTFPVDLAGLTTFVTIEPANDASPGPSGLTILSGVIPADAIDHAIYDMAPTVDALPTLTARVT